MKITVQNLSAAELDSNVALKNEIEATVIFKKMFDSVDISQILSVLHAILPDFILFRLIEKY